VPVTRLRVIVVTRRLRCPSAGDERIRDAVHAIPVMTMTPPTLPYVDIMMPTETIVLYGRPPIRVYTVRCDHSAIGRLSVSHGLFHHPVRQTARMVAMLRSRIRRC